MAQEGERDDNVAVQRPRGAGRRAPLRVVMDLDCLPSFEKKIMHQNQHHDTARRVCELCIPRDFARTNGIDKDKPMCFVTRTLIDNGNRLNRPRFMRMVFRNVDRNDGNFVIRHGWREFTEYHDIKRGWKLRFTLTAPNQLYVQLLKRNTNGVSIPTRL